MRASLWLWAAVLLIGCGDDDADGPNGRGTGKDAGDGGATGVCTVDGACEQRVEVGPPSHVQGDINYTDPPPAGGSHNPCWGDYGVHEEALPAENWVHNLEHGAVVYLYDCPEGCADDVATLSELVEDRPFALLTAYGALSTRFAVVSWGYRLESEELDPAAFAAFYDAHADHGLESITSGAPSGCP
jgi:hypothetical protein